MAVMLDKPLKRELAVGTEPYMLTIAPDGLKLVPKGKRNGVELRWQDLVSGEAALAVALNASIDRLAARDRGGKRPVQAPAKPATQASEARPARSKSPASVAPRPRTRRRG